MSLIIGIDPGSFNTGYGIIKMENKKFTHIDHGIIKLNAKNSFFDRTLILGNQLSDILNYFKPNVMVIEKVFLGKNIDSAFKLGHIRGVCIYQAKKNNCEIFEYAAKSVKKGITGNGGASKQHVQKTILLLLNLNKVIIEEDTSDALALAFYHIKNNQIKDLFIQQGISNDCLFKRKIYFSGR